MIPEKFFNTLNCALATNNHFSELPITLYCGHNACRKCIQQIKHIKCQKCGKISTGEIEKFEVNEVTKNLIEFYIKDLFDLIEEKFKNNISKFKGYLNSKFNKYTTVNCSCFSFFFNIFRIIRITK